MHLILEYSLLNIHFGSFSAFLLCGSISTFFTRLLSLFLSYHLPILALALFLSAPLLLDIISHYICILFFYIRCSIFLFGSLSAFLLCGPYSTFFKRLLSLFLSYHLPILALALFLSAPLLLDIISHYICMLFSNIRCLIFIFGSFSVFLTCASSSTFFKRLLSLFLSYHLPILALALFLSAPLLLDIISHYICILFFYIRCLIFIFGSFSAFLLCASISTFYKRLLSLFLSYHLPILELALCLSAPLLLDVISHFICILFFYIRCLIFIFGSFSAFLLCASISKFFKRLLSLFLSYHLPILALALFLSAPLLLDIISHYICILFFYIRCLNLIFGSFSAFLPCASISTFFKRSLSLFLSYHLPILALALFLSAPLLLDIISHYICIIFSNIRCLIFIFGSLSAFLLCASISTFSKRFFSLFLSYHLPILALALFLSAPLLLDIDSHYICILFFYIRCLIFIFGSSSAFLLCASISTFFKRLLSLFLFYHLPNLALALFLSAP